MIAGPGGTEPVPRADSWGSRSEQLLCPLPPASSSSSPEEANPGSKEEEVRCLRSISEGSEGSQRGAGRRLAVPGSQVQLSSILGDNIYNVPSPRIIPPACPPSVFPADGFSRLLNNWLGSGAPQLTDAALQSPHCSAGCPSPWGGQIAKLGPCHGLETRKLNEWRRSWKQSRVVMGNTRVQAQRCAGN